MTKPKIINFRTKNPSGSAEQDFVTYHVNDLVLVAAETKELLLEVRKMEEGHGNLIYLFIHQHHNRNKNI